MERIGVAFSGGLQPTEIVECVQLAEELGYESAWVAEGHGGDQFSILTACALKTKTILLGTSISPNPPKDTDGRREDSGRVGEGATGEMAGLHWGRLEVGGRSSVAA